MELFSVKYPLALTLIEGSKMFGPVMLNLAAIEASLKRKLPKLQFKVVSKWNTH
jgi:hypothetical protein